MTNIQSNLKSIKTLIEDVLDEGSIYFEEGKTF